MKPKKDIEMQLISDKDTDTEQHKPAYSPPIIPFP